MTDVERFKKITVEMAELFAKKNANYGNSFEKLYNDLGPISGLVPLHNKLDRLTNLVKGGKNDFESIEDTLIDLANYAIMNVIELQKAGENNSASDCIFANDFHSFESMSPDEISPEAMQSRVKFEDTRD